jgi:hypothetical protein
MNRWLLEGLRAQQENKMKPLIIKVRGPAGDYEIDCWDLPMGLSAKEFEEWLEFKIGEELDAKYCDEGPG